MILTANMEQIVLIFIFEEKILLVHEDFFINIEDKTVLDEEEEALLKKAWMLQLQFFVSLQLFFYQRHLTMLLQGAEFERL